MKTLIRIAEILFRILLWAVVVTACCALFSCRGVQYVPVETVKTETERVVDIQRDSIYVLDSVFVRSKADTVFVERWRVEYKEALRVDTLHVFERDSINHVIEVEKSLTWLQELKMDLGAGVMWVAPIVLILYIVYRLRP